MMVVRKKSVNCLSLLRILALLLCFSGIASASQSELTALKRDQLFGGLRVAHLYSDSEGTIVGVKFRHPATDAPIFVLQIESAPQAFVWVDTPMDSNKGLPHSLEHLLVAKGQKGRYFRLLSEMRLGVNRAATSEGYTYYGLAYAASMNDFFEKLHAWLDTLYRPDFSDAEAEREFYHFGIASDPGTGKKTLVEKGTVYDEMLSSVGLYDYWYDITRRTLGATNPFGFSSGGVPDEMRHVTPAEIRRFHHQHYRLGPGTGFIFVIDPKENVQAFAESIAREFDGLPASGVPPATEREDAPKYPIHPSEGTSVKIFPFPSSRDTAPGEVRLSWKPRKVASMLQAKLLQLFFRGLGEGQQSILYKALIDSAKREIDCGATVINSVEFLDNSPFFPQWSLDISGIPGSQISEQRLEALRAEVLKKIREIAGYADGSAQLAAFNDVVSSKAKTRLREEAVWVKDPPTFGFRSSRSDWKEHLLYLETDPSFVRSLSEGSLWSAVAAQQQSGKNIWRDVIETFHLTDMPYLSASAPSPALQEKIEQERQQRIKGKVADLMKHYHAGEDQIALAAFEKDEAVKTREIESIDAKVSSPRFTEHPPLTPDDGIKYRELRLLGDVPVVVSLFERPPTISMNLSFDLSSVPRRYYKYLPLLPSCLDSLGIKEDGRVMSYSELLAYIHNNIYDLVVSDLANPLSKRADLVISTSGTDAAEFRRALDLVHRLIGSKFPDSSSADRLRDIVKTRLADDDAYLRQTDQSWISNSLGALRYQNYPLYLALASHFASAHWDGRLSWLLRKPVDAASVDRLGEFAKNFLSSATGQSRQALSKSLSASTAAGLEGELIAHWKRNLGYFPEDELVEGLRKLSEEVQEDLRTGPEKTIQDLKALELVVFDRKAIHLDLTLSEPALKELTPDLEGFLRSIPAGTMATDTKHTELATAEQMPDLPIAGKVQKRYRLPELPYPWFIGLVNTEAVNGALYFSANLPGYDQIDHESLLRALSSKLLSGEGPQSLFMKTTAAGLAYNSGTATLTRFKEIEYYADRVPDIPALISMVNSTVHAIPDLHNPLLVDYVLQRAFPVPRSIYSPAQRGRVLARDLRDGNEPDKVRRFSEGILALRRDPDLLSKLTSTGLEAIGVVTIDPQWKEQQQKDKSIFFFMAPESALIDMEKRLSIPHLFRVWPSDFWLP